MKFNIDDKNSIIVFFIINRVIDLKLKLVLSCEMKKTSTSISQLLVKKRVVKWKKKAVWKGKHRVVLVKKEPSDKKKAKISNIVKEKS